MAFSKSPFSFPIYFISFECKRLKRKIWRIFILSVNSQFFLWKLWISVSFMLIDWTFIALIKEVFSLSFCFVELTNLSFWESFWTFFFIFFCPLKRIHEFWKKSFLKLSYFIEIFRFDGWFAQNEISGFYIFS